MDERKIVQMLLDHEGRFDELREEIHKLRDETLTGQDQIMTILKRMETEQVSTNHALRRHQDTLDKHEKDITRIKKVVHI